MSIFKALKGLPSRKLKKSYIGVDWEDGVGSLVILDKKGHIVWSWRGEIHNQDLSAIVFALLAGKVCRGRICVPRTAENVITLIQPMREYISRRRFCSFNNNRSLFYRIKRAFLGPDEKEIGLFLNKVVEAHANTLIRLNTIDLDPELVYLYKVALSAVGEDNRWITSHEQ